MVEACAVVIRSTTCMSGLGFGKTNKANPL